MLKEATKHSVYLMNHIFRTFVLINMWQWNVYKLTDFVNIGERSETAKLLFQLIIVLNWVKYSFPSDYRQENFSIENLIDF